MNKAILLSIKPKYVADILNGKKIIEIRKTMPKCDLPIDVYIYCTNDIKQGRKNFYFEELNRLGRVVAKFTLNNIDRYINGHCCFYLNHNASSCLDYELILEPACLTDDELFNYADDYSFYAWHIEDLVIFDKPKELSELRKPDTLSLKQLQEFGLPYDKKTYKEMATKGKWFITKAPQNYCYVESEE